MGCSRVPFVSIHVNPDAQPDGHALVVEGVYRPDLHRDAAAPDQSRITFVDVGYRAVQVLRQAAAILRGIGLALAAEGSIHDARSPKDRKLVARDITFVLGCGAEFVRRGPLVLTEPIPNPQHRGVGAEVTAGVD